MGNNIFSNFMIHPPAKNRSRGGLSPAPHNLTKFDTAEGVIFVGGNEPIQFGSLIFLHPQSQLKSHEP